MSTPRQKVMNDIEVLKQDTSKVLKDITLLTSSLKETGEVEAREVIETSRERIDRELQEIRARIARLNNQMAATARKVDQQVRQNPYPWILGATAAGWLIGRLLGASGRQHRV